MSKRLFVGNIAWSSTEGDIKAKFSEVGEVKSVTIIKDRETGKSKGFCFIDMENADEAISKLDGIELGGRNIRVSEARERAPRNDNRR